MSQTARPVATTTNRSREGTGYTWIVIEKQNVLVRRDLIASLRGVSMNPKQSGSVQGYGMASVGELPTEQTGERKIGIYSNK